MGAPKALLSLRGSTFLETIVAAYRRARITSLITVTHAALKRDPRFPALGDVEVLVLDEPTECPLHTLWHALDHVEGRWTAFFVHPVDHPYISDHTLSAMASLYTREQPLIVQPRYGKSGGHPVLIDASLIPEIRAASLDRGLRQVVRAEPGRVRRLDVKDEGVIKGVNTPEDLIDPDTPNKRLNS
jgi:CTP:molybdopterin cytidylyltransferase MocA